VIDRLTFNALIIQTGTDSYRLRTTAAATTRRHRGGAKSDQHAGARSD